MSQSHALSDDQRQAQAGKYLTFELDRTEFGIEILRVVEILKMLKITTVPMWPDFARGKVITEPAEQIDIAPTVGELLGFDVPEAKGRVLGEIFKKPPAAKSK